MKLWHCAGARSLRPLWALEEMGLAYELEILPFPPRMFNKAYLEVNSLGTVPFLQDGETTMTESSAICQYLVDRYRQYEFGLKPDHREYGAYLNWLHHADATLTFPQTLAMRYYYLEPTPEKQAVADDYARWFIARLRRLDSHLEDHEYLVDGRFTVAIEDVQKVAIPVLRHRVSTNFQAQAEGMSNEDVINRLLKAIPVPEIPKYADVGS